MGEFEVPQAAVEAAGLALGVALAAVTDDEDQTYWAEWHECPGGPCSCAGTPSAHPELTHAALAAAAPHIAAAALRQAAEEMEDRMDRSRASLIYGAFLRQYADSLDGRQAVPDTREGILTAAGLTEADMRERADD